MEKIIEIRKGTGGEEAEIFAEDLMRMYVKYAQANNLKIDLINDQNPISISVSGKIDALKIFENEAGVHRIQRVPKTDKKGRVQTSTCSVAVLTMPEEAEVKLNEGEIRYDYFRSSGNGGQHRNTTDSAVRLTHIPTGIVVTSVNERSQHKNKNVAKGILYAKLVALEKEKAFDKLNSNRSNQVKNNNRSDAKRTYNYQRSTVSDEDTGKTASIKEVLEKGKINLLF